MRRRARDVDGVGGLAGTADRAACPRVVRCAGRGAATTVSSCRQRELRHMAGRRRRSRGVGWLRRRNLEGASLRRGALFVVPGMLARHLRGDPASRTRVPGSPGRLRATGQGDCTGSYTGCPGGARLWSLDRAFSTAYRTFAGEQQARRLGSVHATEGLRTRARTGRGNLFWKGRDGPPCWKGTAPYSCQSTRLKPQDAP